MFEHKKFQSPDDCFLPLDRRAEKGVYFYRINGYNDTIKEFVLKYYEAARVSGVVIEGRIPNPDEKNLAYYNEIMGMSFAMSLDFIGQSLKKWLPRMSDYQRNMVAQSMFDTLDRMRKDGKNDNMLKNAYIKFMCWLYYKFERITSQLGAATVPKILYEGNISNYELKLITILSNAGCDVLFLQRDGDGAYKTLDPNSDLSYELQLPQMTAFPESFNLGWMKDEMVRQKNKQRLYGTLPQLTNCTNAWISGKGLEDILKSLQTRGDKPDLFYNCFMRLNGVEDKLTYLNELHQFIQQLGASKRKILILENSIPQPTQDEVGAIKRQNYANQDQMLLDLSSNIKYTANIELQRLMVKAFIDIMLDEASAEGMNVNRLTNKAVYLLCWIKRYQQELFSNWKVPDTGCVIYLGGCQNDNEAMFIRFLARLPLDVLILVPNLNTKCCLSDSLLYEKNYTQSLVVEQFPRESSQIRVGTAAFHAERELDTLMYQDSGMYRNRQYSKAASVTLQTMYEEIAILWDQELKYRPNFSVVESVVNIPVLFAKVSGVKDGNTQKYWDGICELITPDTFIIKGAPFINPETANPIKRHTADFLKNGKLQRDVIKSHSAYKYGHLRDDIEEHIFDKLQLLIDQKIIRGTFENGTEYTIVSVILNLDNDIVRMIQRFDFTKKNPKVIYINTTEAIISLEDSIVIAFLNLIGFDIMFFIPTGYQNVEKYFAKNVMEEHQIGDYVYDLNVPKLKPRPPKKPSWHEKIFKRGN